MGGQGRLDLLQVLGHEMGRDVPGTEHPGCPVDVVFKRSHASGLEGAGQKVQVEAGVLDAEIAAPLAVTRHPVGVALEEFRGDRLRDGGFQVAEFIGQGHTLGKTVQRHKITRFRVQGPTLSFARPDRSGNPHHTARPKSHPPVSRCTMFNEHAWVLAQLRVQVR